MLVVLLLLLMSSISVVNNVTNINLEEKCVKQPRTLYEMQMEPNKCHCNRTLHFDSYLAESYIIAFYQSKSNIKIYWLVSTDPLPIEPNIINNKTSIRSFITCTRGLLNNRNSQRRKKGDNC